MSFIPALGAPSFNALGDIVDQRLSGCNDAKGAKTRDSRLVNFLNFCTNNDITNYLSPDPNWVDTVISRYIVYIINGYGCTTKFIETKTVKEYLKEINKHYISHGLPPPWVSTAKTKTARLVKDKQTYEAEAKRRDPLTHKCIETMFELARLDGTSEDCFECLMRDMLALGRYTGNRIQEYAMDSPDKIKYYNTPDGDVMRAFSVANILFRDVHGMPLATTTAMETPNLVAQIGTCYDIQKNRNNGQILWYHRDTLNPSYCPVLAALSLVQRAIRLGQSSSDPLCAYSKNGTKVFLTANDVTAYFRYTMKLAHPTITDEMLSAISTHSLRVTACILLAEAGKPIYFIKLRLRWKSNCFEIYLRNTSRVALQHMQAITPANTSQSQRTHVPLAIENLDDSLQQDFGNVSIGDYELEDED